MNSEKLKRQNMILTPEISKLFPFLSLIIVGMIVALIFTIFDVPVSSTDNTGKPNTKVISSVFITFFFCLLVLGIFLFFSPDMKKLFSQIRNVSYVILYTIFAILFYTLVPSDILNTYSYIINPFVILLGVFSFYKGISSNYIEKFNIQYERIKMIAILFCFITFMTVFYNINPGGAASKYFGYSLLLSIVLSVFAFLYLIILMTLPLDSGKYKSDLLSNFSAYGIFGTLLFITFLVAMSIIISTNKATFFEDKTKSSIIMIYILLISIIWSILLGSNLFSSHTDKLSPRVEFLKKSLLVLLGLVMSGLLIYWITYNIESLSSGSSITQFILNLLLVAIILGLIYKTINVKLPAGNEKKNAFFALMSAVFLYIPCVLNSSFDWLGKQVVGQYHATEAGSGLMLLVAIGIIVAYFKTPSLFNAISSQGGNQLVNRPVYTNTIYNLGNYQELNGGSETFDYQYAISCWVFIDAAPPNMNSNYNNYTSLLNFGQKPNILYNGKKNSLMITMQQKDLKNKTTNDLLDFDDNGNRIIYVKNDFLLQKWNNIVLNYNGGTLDVFLNGELVKSSIEVVPYYTYDSLTIGQNDGINGGICNVVYFRKALTSQNIYYIYNSVKGRSPPVLNDSNETILVKNINQTTNSVNSVI